MQNLKTYTTNCSYCKKELVRYTKNHPKHTYKYINDTYKNQYDHYCSKECKKNHTSKSITLPCGWCQKDKTITLAEFKKSKSGLAFCNKSCSASYNNTLKRKSRRSKCEKMLFELLINEYPNLTIINNDKILLDGYECDISIPDLKLAIEWNGIVHFKPIYGQTKLDNIQQRDMEKQKIAVEKQINLIVIPDLVSSEKYVKESFQKIKIIINNLIKAPEVGIGPTVSFHTH